MINDKDLNNGILRVRYLNNRKLTNNLLKHDLSIILIPVIDNIKNTVNIDQRIVMCKLKKDLKELYNYKSSTFKNLDEEEIDHLYTKLTNKLSVINTF